MTDRVDDLICRESERVEAQEPLDVLVGTHSMEKKVPAGCHGTIIT